MRRVDGQRPKARTASASASANRGLAGIRNLESVLTNS